jgi:hypothetical protein
MLRLQWGKQGPRAALFGGRVAEASFLAGCSKELLGGALDRGPLWGRRPTMN